MASWRSFPSRGYAVTKNLTVSSLRTEPLTLSLVDEAKVATLLRLPLERRLEASGVLARAGQLFVIFDNASSVGRLSAQLQNHRGQNSLIPLTGGRGMQYEDIAYDGATGRFYVLIEALPRDDIFMARVEEYDETFQCLDSRWLNFALDRANKGIEGLTCVRRGEHTYLLALCEGNRCESGAAGRKPGGGRVQIFVAGSRNWDHVGTIRLPKSVLFEDYSSIAILDDRVAVISQESSALWVGALHPRLWEFKNEGAMYLFPRDSERGVLYSGVEGVSWLDTGRVAVVSDRSKDRGSKRSRAKEQSIHIFDIPDFAADSKEI